MSETDVISRINLYPIKGLHAATVEGEEPQTLDVGETGLQAFDVRDREYVIVETEVAAQGLFVSQRGWNARRKTVHRGDRRLATLGVNVETDHLTISAPGFGSFELDTAYQQVSEPIATKVHDDELAARDQGSAAAEFLSSFLGREVRLARASRETPRMLSDQYVRFRAANRLAGADSMPILLTSGASLEWLLANQKLRPGEEPLGPDAISLANYRSNIEIEGRNFGAFREDYIVKAAFGVMQAYIVKACSRCPVPNIDQDSGTVSNASSRLMRQRAGIRVGEDEPGIFMGQNLNHIYEPGLKVNVNDTVAILTESSKPNLNLNQV